MTIKCTSEARVTKGRREMGAGMENKRLESEKWDSQRTTLKSNDV